MRDHPFSGTQCTNSDDQDRTLRDDGDDDVPQVAPGGSDDPPFEVRRDRHDDYDFEHLSADGPTYLRQLQAREQSRRSSAILARGHASRKHDLGAEDPHDQDGRDDTLAYRHRDGSFRRRKRPLARRRRV